MQEPEITTNFEYAMERLRTFKGPTNYAALAGDPSNFKLAILTDAGFCGLWEIESDPWILGLGEFQPTFIPTLRRRVTSDQVRVTIPRNWTQVELEKRSEWNFFLIDSAITPMQPLKHLVVELHSDKEINSFIDNYAPDSSTRADDPEVLFWEGIRNPQGDLLSIGASVRWKSGPTMVVSIATAPTERGKSMAQEVTASLVKRLFDLGSPIVGLGVWAANAPAIRAYERVGFQLQEEFVSGPLLRA
jgi:ribosomal protein S18 acetylase RimI-like enzyme